MSDIRRAYRALARQLHPDRHQQSSPERAEAAAGRMRELNAAWEVLSDRAAKELYDLERSLAAARRAGTATPSPPPAPSPRSPSSPGEGGFDPIENGETVYFTPGGGFQVARGLLWVVLLGVLGAIFLFTAYAANSSNTGDSQSTAPTTVPPARLEVGDCANEVAGAFDLVSCSGPHDARIVALVAIGRPCVAGAREVYLPDQQESACLLDY